MAYSSAVCSTAKPSMDWKDSKSTVGFNDPAERGQAQALHPEAKVLDLVDGSAMVSMSEPNDPLVER